MRSAPSDVAEGPDSRHRSGHRLVSRWANKRHSLTCWVASIKNYSSLALATYSITSSARSKISCGTAAPSAMAALRSKHLKFDRQLNRQVGPLGTPQHAIDLG